MSRTIKFRYIWKQSSNGEYIIAEPSLEDIEGGLVLDMVMSLKLSVFVARVQFTGIIDKNDKEVCDKDIVRTFDYDGSEELVGVVTQQSPTMWFFQGFKDFADTCVQGDSHKETFCYGTIDSALFHCGNRCEIVGNIYEHPELLEAGQ